MRQLPTHEINSRLPAAQNPVDDPLPLSADARQASVTTLLTLVM